MMPKRTPSIVAAPILALALAACSAGSGPASVAEAWLEAFIAQDGNKTASLTCDAVQDDLMMGAGVLAVTQLLSGQIVGASADIDLSDMRYDVLRESADEAIVRAHGTMRVSLLGIPGTDELDSTVRLVKEDGAWKVCEDA